MASAVEQLTRLIDAKDRFDIPYEELLPLQIEAANERFQDRIGKIRLLRQRAETEKVTAIGGLDDLVPLLFAHTAYKSYPDNWFNQGKWDRMGMWLDTVSTIACGTSISAMSLISMPGSIGSRPPATISSRRG